MGYRRQVIGAAAAAAIATVMVASLDAGASRSDGPPHVGRMDPAQHFTPDGTPLKDKMPEFVPVAGADGESPGYISREELYPESFGKAARADGRQTVVDLKGNVVGYMFPGVGFVTKAEAQSPGFDATSRSRTTVVQE